MLDKAIYYDVESMHEAFTVTAFNAGTKALDIFYVIDPVGEFAKLQDENERFILTNRLTRFIRNTHSKEIETIEFHNLRDRDEYLKFSEMFLATGSTILYRYAKSDGFPLPRPVADFDAEFDPATHPFLIGYNSFNYDLTIIANFINNSVQVIGGTAHDNNQPPQFRFAPESAASMRAFNDKLFTSKYINNMSGALEFNAFGGDAQVRQAMLTTGRHIDAARLNEKQSRVRLKRIAAMLGLSIKEFEGLDSGHLLNETHLDDLIVYNVSDVLCLRRICEHPAYSSAFKVKYDLLKTYDETRMQPGGFSPRRDRLRVDSTSAQFVTRVLAPDQPLGDNPVVTLDYPHPDVFQRWVEEADNPDSDYWKSDKGIQDVLELVKRVFYDHTKFEDGDTDEIKDNKVRARAAFEPVYEYYRQFIGLDFGSEEAPVIKQHDCMIPYFNKEAQPTSCYVNFSIGGIHGAEVDAALLQQDLKDFEAENTFYQKVIEDYPNPLDLHTAWKNKQLPNKPNGEPLHYKQFLRSSVRVSDLQAACQGVDPNDKQTLAALQERFYRPAPKCPQVFYRDKGDLKVTERYRMVSSGRMFHADFESYYPGLLSNMMAFFNAALGEDRYYQLFLNKREYGLKMKDPSLSESERIMYSAMRAGVKLLLNSASGAADAKYDTNIRMNNRIIQMRITGQLFTWIGSQIIVWNGGDVPSTNTDGVYAKHLTTDQCDKAVDDMRTITRVPIEAEPVLLISKDSNNRLELNVDSHRVVSAAGGTLACLDGPDPSKSLAHPAVFDYALSRELTRKCLADYHRETELDPAPDATEPYISAFRRDLDAKAVRSDMEQLIKDDPLKALRMFQTILNASPSSYRYICDHEGNYIGRTNRGFIVDAKKAQAAALDAPRRLRIAELWKVPERVNAARALKASTGAPVSLGNPDAKAVVAKAMGRDVSRDDWMPPGREPRFISVPNLSFETDHVLIYNDDLSKPQAQLILKCLDLNWYVDKVTGIYNGSWRNGDLRPDSDPNVRILNYQNLPKAPSELLERLKAEAEAEVQTRTETQAQVEAEETVMVTSEDEEWEREREREEDGDMIVVDEGDELQPFEPSPPLPPPPTPVFGQAPWGW